jgi:hypothetical protein
VRVAEGKDVAGEGANLTVGAHNGDHDRSRAVELPRCPRSTPTRDVSTAESGRDEHRHRPTDHLGRAVAEQRRRAFRPVRDPTAPIRDDEGCAGEIHVRLRGRVHRDKTTAGPPYIPTPKPPLPALGQNPSISPARPTRHAQSSSGGGGQRRHARPRRRSCAEMVLVRLGCLGTPPAAMSAIALSSSFMSRWH